MTTRNLSIEVEGVGRFRTVHVKTQITLGELHFAVQVDTAATAKLVHLADPREERAHVQDAVIKAITAAVQHPAFEL